MAQPPPYGQYLQCPASAIEMAKAVKKCVYHYPWWLWNAARPHYVFSTFVDVNQKMKKLDKLGLEKEIRALEKHDTNASILKSNELLNGLKKVLDIGKQLNQLLSFAFPPDVNDAHKLEWQNCTAELVRLHRCLYQERYNYAGARGAGVASDAGLVALLGQLQSVWGAEGEEGVTTRRLACHDL